MRPKLFGIAIFAGLCLFATPGAKAQPSCILVGQTPLTASVVQYYTITNHCAFPIEGVFSTRSGGSYSFGPLTAGESSLLQSTATGAYHLYVCSFPKLPRVESGPRNWPTLALPTFSSDQSRVACE